MCVCASGYVPVVALHIMSITVVFIPPIPYFEAVFLLLFSFVFFYKIISLQSTLPLHPNRVTIELLFGEGTARG